MNQARVRFDQQAPPSKSDRRSWFCLIAFVALASPVGAQTKDISDGPLKSLSILALGALDGRAVIKTPDNKMHVLKLGDVIPGTQATVSQILADKLVVEDVVETGLQQTVWITKGGADGKVIVQRMSMEAAAPQVSTRTTLVFKAVEPDSKNKDKKKGDK
jgi:hypothetical protein